MALLHPCAALRVILKDRNLSYSDALLTLKMKSLKDRREDLCLRFAKNCLKVEKLRFEAAMKDCKAEKDALKAEKDILKAEKDGMRKTKERLQEIEAAMKDNKRRPRQLSSIG